ncbi:M24 family metallopeptidase [Caulobacter vibrioides]|jgi:Xaa-Pro dipeptidase|uniref:Xaa-Pro aminopeptidase n=3 Tax=Pseudomonadota TaxID=1224 RepID=R0EM07_CAUVI|nr:Xaa-Pro peptidase family protein [Caulobacter vibrioides]ENZ82117.1 Xaa-Pro aminopeptidase [Caulobacter vibrioides OR37]
MTALHPLRRRELLASLGAGALAAAVPAWARPDAPRKMTDGVALIGPAERQARLERAQALMVKLGLSAIVTEAGSSMDYFTGAQWSRSERPVLAIIPREGQVGMVMPKFEEPSIRQSLSVPAEVRPWEEDENAYAIAAGLLADRKLASGTIGVEETTRDFIVEGLTQALPSAKVASGAAVFRGCRMIKTPAEIALMQVAADITVAALRHTHANVRAGMGPKDIAALMSDFTVAQGARVSFNLILIGEASAYPHGSRQPQIVGEGQVVLMDCGCNVGGYESDISRTFVFGEPTARQRKVWNDVARGQQVAFEAAQIGAEAGSVDRAVRAYYESLGWGPRYKLPGLSHRTGHGIGMDGHEPVNFVMSETTRLAPGMCFSDEPGIYIPDEFGVRLEDCIHLTPQGPKWFSEPPKSLDKPMG